MFDYTKCTGQESYTLFDPVNPHPDGKAWPKCCRDIGNGLSCAFVPNQPHGARLSKDRGNAPYIGGGIIHGRPIKDVPFVCVHRSTDDGYHRVCAGWDACFGNKHHGVT